MALSIQQCITGRNFTKGNNRKIEFIVIHYFGALGSAKGLANYFTNASRPASAHYALDEGSTVYQCVDDKDIAWHCGTNKTYYHDRCRNTNSIGIEVRPRKVDASRASVASDTDWYFTPATVNNLVEFTRMLMKKYSIPVENVVRHYDVTHKLCPRPWVGDDLNTYTKQTGNAAWLQFKKRLVEEDTDLPNIEDLTPEQCITLWNKITEPLRDNDSGQWSDAARQWAIQNGIIAGSGGANPNYQWQAPMTREQFCVMAYRLAKLFGKA